MLKSIYLKNIVLIDELEIEFSTNTTCIIGESGSGKSVILDAIGIIIGSDRASGKILRHGESRGVIIANFDVSGNKNILSRVEECGYDVNDGILIIKKIINKESSSKIMINDIQASVNFVKELMSELINIHGQNDSFEMLKQSSHINILDDCLGYFQLKKDIVDIYDDLSEKLKYRDGAMEELRFKKINLEDLENAKNDLDSYKIYEGEEKDLFDKRVEYLKSERTINFFEALDQKISNESFSSGMLALSRFDGSDLPSEIKSNIQVISDLLDNAHSTIDEAKNTLSDIISYFNGKFDFDINLIEERIELINEISNKYKIQGSVWNFIEENQRYLTEIDYMEKQLNDLDAEIFDLKEKYKTLSLDLYHKRSAFARDIEEKITLILRDLNMIDAEFLIKISHDENRFSKTGSDAVVFTARLNKGTDFAPINAIASGGEISRLVLAMKSAISEKLENKSVIIFDEIETGLSANIAKKVAMEIAKIAKNNQVILITHDPHLAAISDKFIKIVKTLKDDRSKTFGFEVLSNDDKTTEIAKMISEDISESSIIMAKEMLNSLTSV
jgi:DNA repair protein RecN (Recombination protein N)